MKRLFTNHRFIISLSVIAALALGSGGYWYILTSQPKSGNYTWTDVTNKTIVEEVDVSGNVKAAEEVALAFLRSGKIGRVAVSEGDTVKQGQLLASLVNDDLLATLKKAVANVSQAQNRLTELKNGTRSEVLQIDQTALASAQAAADQANVGLLTAARAAYTSADDAVRNQADAMFTTPRQTNAHLAFQINDSQLKINIENGRVKIEALLVAWNNALNAPDADPTASAALAKTNLDTVQTFLNQLAYALNNNVISSSQTTQATLAGYQTVVSVARTEINQTEAALVGAQSGAVGAAANVNLAQDKLTLDEAGATPQTIAAAAASLEAAQADQAAAEAEINKTRITAPFDGVVTNVDAKVGESANPNAPLISVISAKNFQLEAFVSESDVAKITPGLSANVTLDALGDDPIFSAHVVTVDAAQTMVKGVATYKVTLELDKEDTRIKSGMTANIHIITATHEDVVGIPRQSVITRGDNKFVLVAGDNGAPVERQVTLGLEDAHGLVEVLTGLSAGERILKL
ncbi:MAG TPA: efflux RND transporter periplasmic adaptor subunit [Candidatus Paceibacterota bacterium]|nr:efflux RND transporter periplasmic adaptor subunit [Candidatus Paceibacterota bacterium]